MKRLHILARTGLLILMFVPLGLADNWILHLKDASKLGAVAQQFGIQATETLHGPKGIYLISLPSGPLGNVIADALKADPAVQNVEPDSQAALPETGSNYRQPKSFSVTNTPFGCLPASTLGQLVPAAYYLQQPAVCLISLPAAHNNYGFGSASVKMALIDTWVDWTHPAFHGSVDWAGSRDFTTGVAGGSALTQETSPMVDQETSPMVDQETSPMVDGSGTIILNQETSPMVDQETSPMVDAKYPPYFGHGTGVAGIMHLVAPSATIIALKAFNTTNGSGTVSSIIAAIQYAISQHVNVINMSFSMSGRSQELADAVSDAIHAGIVVVASVADNPGAAPVYPAGLDGVSSVGCSDNSDRLCAFSGTGNVTVYAPGFQVMSPYPNGHWALFTGTSFSAPFATGTGALMGNFLSGGSSPSQAMSQDLRQGADRIRDLPRLDVNGTISRAAGN